MNRIKAIADDFTTFIAESAVGKAFLTERAAAAQSERRRLRTQLRDARAREDAEIATIEAQMPATLSKLDKARRAYEAAELAAQQLQFRRRHVRGGESGVIERELLKLADPRIEEAKGRLVARGEQFRHRQSRGLDKVDERPDPGGLRDDEMRPVKIQFNNEPARRRIFSAYQDARLRLEQLPLEAPDDIEAAIAAIEGSIPWDAVAELTPVGAGPVAA